MERPSSVVKELVENSLDAQASRIEVFIEQGGRQLIRVQDDGIGMNAEEMVLSIERHATSKIKSLDDLFSISTLGFRGEALPSVAAISRFTLISCPQSPSNLSGFEISIEGGKILHQRESGHPTGTTIEVKDLFFNTPARLKFLKSNETEWGHIEDYLSAMALAYPQVQFFAHHNGKQKIKYAAHQIEDRIGEVFGADLQEAFYPIFYEQGEFRLEGYVGHPNLGRSSSSSVYFFLNRRPIKDRLIHHAVMSGYRNLLMKDQYPSVVLFLTVPPQSVDVNVHPSKREVRFGQPNVIHNFVSQAIQKTLASMPWAKKTISELPISEESFSASPPAPKGWIAEETRAQPEIFSYQPSTPYDSQSTSQWFSQNYQSVIQEGASFSKVGRLPFSELQVIGQLKKTYILCESDEHLVLIDQHAAHERIGFEKFRRAYHSGNIPSQRLLVPETLPVKGSEIEALRPHLLFLNRLGLEIEEFGPQTLVVQSVPALLGNVSVPALFRDLLDDLKEHGSSVRLEDRSDELFALMACHRQIRAGDTLSQVEMESLVKELDEGAYGYHCPHGRPVMVQIGFREVEKWFKRIV